MKAQMSETKTIGIIMALSGGFMDAYTYLVRGEVFANAQTGNILLFGVNLSTGNLPGAARYFFPVFSFAAGVFVAQILRNHFKGTKKIHWRQICVLLEALILIAVSMIGTDVNLIANSLVSFACGIQVQSFRKIRGNALATTMCIGNLRTATDFLCSYVENRDREALRKSMMYFGVIGVFALGAVLGNLFVIQFGTGAILFSSALLTASFVIMTFERNH